MKNNQYKRSGVVSTLFSNYILQISYKVDCSNPRSNVKRFQEPQHLDSIPQFQKQLNAFFPHTLKRSLRQSPILTPVRLIHVSELDLYFGCEVEMTWSCARAERLLTPSHDRFKKKLLYLER